LGNRDSVTQIGPRRVGRLKRMRGLNTSRFSRVRRFAAAICSCLGCDRTQNQAQLELAPSAVDFVEPAASASDMCGLYAGTGRRLSANLPCKGLKTELKAVVF